jgi:hypothetical protein
MEFLDAAKFPSRLWEFSLEGKFRGVIVAHDLHFLLIWTRNVRINTSITRNYNYKPQGDLVFPF